MKDTTYYLVGRHAKSNSNYTETTWDLALLKMDQQMNLLDTVIFTTHPDTSHRIAFNQALSFDHTGNYIYYAGTFNYNLSEPTEFIPERRRFQILKTDLNGNLIWRKVYGQNYGDVNFTMYAMAATSDGGIIMTGSMWDYGSNPNYLKRQIYVLKTDSLGNAITGFGKDYTAQNISVYPNPATDAASINHPELPSGSRVIIYNLTGSITGELFTHSSSTQLDFTGYAPGVYIISIPAANFRYKLVKVN